MGARTSRLTDRTRSALAHAGHVVRRARDAQRDVELGRDRPARLADESLLGQASVVGHRPRRPHRALEQLGELVRRRRAVSSPAAPDAGRDDAPAWTRSTERASGGTSLEVADRGRPPASSVERPPAPARARPPPAPRRAVDAGQVEGDDRRRSPGGERPPARSQPPKTGLTKDSDAAAVAGRRRHHVDVAAAQRRRRCRSACATSGANCRPVSLSGTSDQAGRASRRTRRGDARRRRAVEVAAAAPAGQVTKRRPAPRAPATRAASSAARRAPRPPASAAGSTTTSGRSAGAGSAARQATRMSPSPLTRASGHVALVDGHVHPPRRHAVAPAAVRARDTLPFRAKYRLSSASLPMAVTMLS